MSKPEAGVWLSDCELVNICEAQGPEVQSPALNQNKTITRHDEIKIKTKVKQEE